jgi:hypothetical protein
MIQPLKENSMTAINKIYSLLALLIITLLACNAPTAVQSTQSAALPPSTSGDSVSATETITPVQHVLTPSVNAADGNIIFDVDSSGTGSEKRAPYGDSYDINLLERPFLKDMTYVPDIDITTFNISDDDTWHYVSIKLIGSDPNNSLGIDYAVELDTNKDGFGDFIIWAKPPYTNEWATDNVQVFADKNHNTSGISANKSDAPYSADGYETLVFDGAKGSGGDADLAWVRMSNTKNATLQFAFKKSLAGNVFMIGVMSDAGLKDVTKLDYVDRFTEQEAGSPIRNKKYYPLGALYSVDNTCREAFGFAPRGDENMLCPAQQQSPAPSQNNNPSKPKGCQPPGGSCPTGYYWWPAPHCACSITPYHP